MSAFPLKGDPFDGNYVYETGGYYSSMHFSKLNIDNGQVVWSSSVTWDATGLTFGLDYSIYAPQVLATIQGQVIIEKAENILTTIQQPTVNQIFSLDANTGQKLWSMNVAANIYNPTVYNNLLLFSASDGYFYALNLAEGTITWKTNVDTQNLFSFANSTMYLLSPNFQINSKDQRLLWSFAVKQGDSPGNYTATLCNLNLANGNMIWTKQIEEKWVDAPRAGLAVNNDRIFLTGNAALWIFNASTGDLVQSQQFDHYITPPIVLGNETFVAADLWLTAYN
jgi:outer membrane protein assembly factor BamB